MSVVGISHPSSLTMAFDAQISQGFEHGLLIIVISSLGYDMRV